MVIKLKNKKGFNLLSVIIVICVTSIVSGLTTGVIVTNSYKNNLGLTYEDLVNITYDDNNNIDLISVNTVLVNKLARQFYQVAQIYLDNMGEKGIDIALGTFTGLPFLVGIGPKVNIKLVSVGAMTASFSSQFLSAGINQTNHSLKYHLPNQAHDYFPL